MASRRGPPVTRLLSAALQPLGRNIQTGQHRAGYGRSLSLSRRPRLRPPTVASRGVLQDVLNRRGRVRECVALESLFALEVALLFARHLPPIWRIKAIVLPYGAKEPWSPDPSRLSPSCCSSLRIFEIPRRFPLPSPGLNKIV